MTRLDEVSLGDGGSVWLMWRYGDWRQLELKVRSLAPPGIVIGKFQLTVESRQFPRCSVIDVERMSVGKCMPEVGIERGFCERAAEG
jgi:hypothetical protein